MGTNYKLRNVGWNEIRELSKNILFQIKKENIEIDTLVTIFRGGSVLSLILSANIDNLKTINSNTLENNNIQIISSKIPN